MKNLKLLGAGKLFFLSITMMAIFIIACNKSNMYQNQIQPSINTISLSEDSVFKSFVSEITHYNEIISNASEDTIMNQEDFELNFKNAVKNNDASSKKLIANTMGFSNEQDFWDLRNKIANKIYLLSKRYDIKNISSEELNNIVTKQISKSKINYLSSKKINGLGGAADFQSCIEFLRFYAICV
jgi:hypothetical protein